MEAGLARGRHAFVVYGEVESGTAVIHPVPNRVQRTRSHGRSGVFFESSKWDKLLGCWLNEKE